MMLINSHNVIDAMDLTGARPRPGLAALQLAPGDTRPMDGADGTGLSGAAATDVMGVYETQTIGVHTHAAVRTHAPVPANAFWSNCPKFGKTNHFQRWKLPL